MHIRAYSSSPVVQNFSNSSQQTLSEVHFAAVWLCNDGLRKNYKTVETGR